MKPLPLKVDNYIFERITEEAKAKKVTKAEDDIADINLIQDRLAEPDVPAHKVHAQLSKNH